MGTSVLASVIWKDNGKEVVFSVMAGDNGNVLANRLKGDRVASLQGRLLIEDLCRWLERT